MLILELEILRYDYLKTNYILILINAKNGLYEIHKNLKKK